MLEYIVGPIVGAIIGCFTNYIAVKMLFYPRKEVRVFGRRLPFTPGAIPKGKERLARSIGTVVSDNLLSKADLEKRLLSDEAVAFVERTVGEVLNNSIETNVTPLLPAHITFDETREKVIHSVSKGIDRTVAELDVGGLVAEQIKGFIRDKLARNHLGFLVNESMLNAITGSVSDGINQYCDTHAYDIIEKEVAKKAMEVSEKSIVELAQKGDVQESTVKKVVMSAYENIVENSLEGVLRRFDFAGMMEKKINDMTPEQLEKLVFTVMKKELNTIVSLGAVIGFVLGLIMLFF